jgi:Protein of unknown function (DUF2845)
MKLRSVSLLMLIACIPTLSLAQAYRCTVNGEVVYQQLPCQGAGTKLNVPKPPDPETREGRLSLAIAKKEVFIGMTSEEVVRSWGKPNKINRSVSARSVHEQWIYERGSIGRSQYLYMEDGTLRSLQSPE